MTSPGKRRSVQIALVRAPFTKLCMAATRPAGTVEMLLWKKWLIHWKRVTEKKNVIHAERM
jgi:hypothetical protein